MLQQPRNTSIEQLKHIISKAILLAFIIVEQPVIQAVISYVEIFDCTKSEFESWIMSVENAVQILGQSILCIAFSIITGSPLMLACRLRDRVPNLTWDGLKNELSRVY